MDGKDDIKSLMMVERINSLEGLRDVPIFPHSSLLLTWPFFFQPNPKLPSGIFTFNRHSVIMKSFNLRFWKFGWMTM